MGDHGGSEALGVFSMNIRGFVEGMEIYGELSRVFFIRNSYTYLEFINTVFD